MLYLKKFTFNPFSENTYLLYTDQKNAFLIDPGNVHDFETEELEKFIRENGLKIQNILLTHAHIDHVLGLQWAFDKYLVPVLMSETEKEILDRNPMTAQQYGFFFKPFKGDIQYISEGDIIHLDEYAFKIYEVPGHSPGHLAYHNEGNKIVVSGDVLFQGSIGRTDLYKSDTQQLLDSIQNKLFVLDDSSKVFPGHGNSTTIGFEKLHNPFLK